MIQKKELSIQRDQASQQKAEFEKEIEKLLFDNREIKEHSRKTQRELSKEISSLTSELKDERDRIHELQKENRKLRQEVKTGYKTECPRTWPGLRRTTTSLPSCISKFLVSVLRLFLCIPKGYSPTTKDVDKTRTSAAALGTEIRASNIQDGMDVDVLRSPEPGIARSRTWFLVSPD